MSDETDEWTWWVGHDDERYHTSCATREEAVQIAQDQGGGYIVEAQPPASIKLSGYFCAEQFLESAEEDAMESHGDPESDMPIFDTIGADLEKDLQAIVRAAIDAWQEKHSLVFRGWAFSAIRNGEYIPDHDQN